jgi:ribosome biogenesis GTPase
MYLEQLGWNSFFLQSFKNCPFYSDEFTVGRVAVEYANRYDVFFAEDECSAELSGKLRFDSEFDAAELPSVGDWVVMQLFDDNKKAIIHYVLPRKSKFSRKVAGKKTEEQIVSANIDLVFIVMGADGNFNIRRLERYLTTAFNSGAKPVIVLNKTDLSTDKALQIQQIKSVASEVPVVAMSAISDESIDELTKLILPGLTCVFLGSSGVGKSSIINRITGNQRLTTGAVSDFNSKGKHTTTHRELILLNNGGIVIDTPGMRELQLWEDDDGLDSAFEEIVNLEAQCRFSNCQHENEPDCAVREALQSGLLDSKRYQSYLKLKKELAYIERKNNKGAASAERDKWKKIHKELKNHPKNKR